MGKKAKVIEMSEPEIEDEEDEEEDEEDDEDEEDEEEKVTKKRKKKTEKEPEKEIIRVPVYVSEAEMLREILARLNEINSKLE